MTPTICIYYLYEDDSEAVVVAIVDNTFVKHNHYRD